jgi:hypothetical protein
VSIDQVKAFATSGLVEIAMSSASRRFSHGAGQPKVDWIEKVLRIDQDPASLAALPFNDESGSAPLPNVTDFRERVRPPRLLTFD